MRCGLLGTTICCQICSVCAVPDKVYLVQVPSTSFGGTVSVPQKKKAIRMPQTYSDHKGFHFQAGQLKPSALCQDFRPHRMRKDITERERFIVGDTVRSLCCAVHGFELLVISNGHHCACRQNACKQQKLLERCPSILVLGQIK